MALYCVENNVLDKNKFNLTMEMQKKNKTAGHLGNELLFHLFDYLLTSCKIHMNVFKIYRKKDLVHFYDSSPEYTVKSM